MTESSHILHKRHEDRISKLPDEILISIISRLELREATATSLVSSCWRYLHTYTTQLNFPRRSIHVNIVNRVLDSHRGGHIKELEVETHNSIGVDKLLEFALTKKAQRIHLQVRDAQFITLSTTISKYHLGSLKELSLFSFHMTDQDFHLFVSNCLALESLSITFPLKLENVSIVGHSKLKHFDMSYAWGVGSIEIRDAINLVSFKLYEVTSKCVVVQLSNIPKLRKVDYEETFDSLPHADFFAKMPRCIRDQLHVLHLSTSSTSIYPDDDELLVDMTVGLTNVTHLELVIDLGPRPCEFFLLSLHTLIKACPSLQKLIIKFSWKLHKKGFKKVEALTKSYKLSPNYLKEMEISGYRGSPFELNLALHIINEARALEKLTLLPCDLNDTIREEALARAQCDFQHIPSFKLLI